MEKNMMANILTHAPYDPILKGYRPLVMAACICFGTKKRALEYARAIGWPRHSVKPLVNRFGRCWGLRYAEMSDQFLIDPCYDINNNTMANVGREQPSPELMKAYIFRCTNQTIRIPLAT